MTTQAKRIIAVAMNPAIDRVLEVPRLTLGAHQVARLLTCYPGGKAVNVAKGLSLLGVPCVLAGFVGRHEHEYFARDAATYRIRMEMLPVAGSTRQNVTLVDPVAHSETHLRDEGFTVSASELDSLHHRLAGLAGPDAVLVFSGSLPPGCAPETFQDLLAICRGTGVQLAIDVSGPALATAVSAGCWLIKPNQQELEELIGHNVHTTQELIAAGLGLAGRIELVLVSCGAAGAYLFARNGAHHGRCEVAPDQIINTVGCGDALLAGFLAGLHRQLDHAESLRLAVAAAAAAAVSLTPQFDRTRMEALQEQAEVTEL
jgi:1-phosphofructokinase